MKRMKERENYTRGRFGVLGIWAHEKGEDRHGTNNQRSTIYGF